VVNGETQLQLITLGNECIWNNFSLGWWIAKTRSQDP